MINQDLIKRADAQISHADDTMLGIGHLANVLLGKRPGPINDAVMAATLAGGLSGGVLGGGTGALAGLVGHNLFAKKENRRLRDYLRTALLSGAAGVGMGGIGGGMLYGQRAEESLPFYLRRGSLLRGALE